MPTSTLSIIWSLMKNLIKSVKKLKLWSKKNRKKKKHENNYEHPPHLPCHHCYSCSTSTTQPSAPHLPSFSWLEEVEQDNNYDYGTFLLPPEMAYPPSQAQDIGVSVSEPVYGIPVLTLTERSTGQFGCVFSFGAYLFHCLCPCFHIRRTSLNFNN